MRVLLKNEKASTTLGLTLSHLVDFDRHQGDKIVPQHLVPTSPPKHNQRQLIADKGSFDGGLCNVAQTANKHRKGCRERHGRISDSSEPGRVGIGATFRAALPERQINVDRVSINGGLIGAPRDFVSSLTLMAACRVTSNADSYSQCFCQFDCILGLNKAARVFTLDFTPNPVGVCRIDWVAQLINSTGIGVITFPVAKDTSHIPGRILLGSCGQKKSSGMLSTALQTSIGSGP